MFHIAQRTKVDDRETWVLIGSGGGRLTEALEFYETCIGLYGTQNVMLMAEVGTNTMCQAVLTHPDYWGSHISPGSRFCRSLPRKE